MLFVPKEKPVIHNLNTYYIDIGKLIEHYQGEIGCGAVYFHSPKSRAILFFDQIEILNAAVEGPDELMLGQSAIEHMLKGSFAYNLSVDIYQLSQKVVYFWANLPGAERIYKDLSTDFTDLEGLVKKMEIEKLTGFIEISVNNQKQGGMIFVSNGGIVGGSFSWEDDSNSDTRQNLEKLIEVTRQSGGVFQVSRLNLNEIETEDKSAAKDRQPELGDTIGMLEELLGIFDTFYTSLSNKNKDFSKLLRKTFMRNLERYEFLDPFAAEFEYHDHKVTYSGDAAEEELIEGVCVCVKDLARELGLTSELRRHLDSWYTKHKIRLKNLNIDF